MASQRHIHIVQRPMVAMEWGKEWMELCQNFGSQHELELHSLQKSLEGLGSADALAKFSMCVCVCMCV
jgi:hypothetical protein